MILRIPVIAPVISLRGLPTINVISFVKNVLAQFGQWTYSRVATRCEDATAVGLNPMIWVHLLPSIFCFLWCKAKFSCLLFAAKAQIISLTFIHEKDPSCWPVTSLL